MNTNQNKIKTSTRRHHDETAIKRQVKIAKQHGMKFNDEFIKQPHRLSKHHAMDCGNPGCMLCSNPRRNKLFKTKDSLTAQERRMYQDTDVPNDKRSNGLPTIEEDPDKQ